MPDVLCNALIVQGDIYRILGDPQAALRAYQAALAVGEGRWNSLGAQYRLGMALVDLGQPEEGLRQVEEAYTAARRLDLGEIYLPAMTVWALLLARTGRLEDALAMVQSWTWLAQERRHIPSGVVRVFVLSLDAIRRGDEREVRSLIAAALNTTRELSNPLWELQCYHTLARLGPLAKPETARVHELLELMARRARDPELRPLVEAFLRRSRAALLGLS
jgi:tetratricopeptide (TPR) repeat protein